jgi:hypothetical protein
MFSCLKFGIEISMLEEKSLMVLIVLGNLKYNKKSTFKSEVFNFKKKNLYKNVKFFFFILYNYVKNIENKYDKAHTNYLQK